MNSCILFALSDSLLYSHELPPFPLGILRSGKFIQSTSSYYTYERINFILFFHLPQSFPSGLFPMGFPTKYFKLRYVIRWAEIRLWSSLFRRRASPSVVTSVSQKHAVTTYHPRRDSGKFHRHHGYHLPN